MSIFFSGETCIFQFQAEVSQSIITQAEYLQITPRPQSVQVKFPKSKKFDSQILLTTARLIFFEPSQTDILRTISAKVQLKETLQQQFFLSHISKSQMASSNEIILNLISPLKISIKLAKADLTSKIFDFIALKSSNIIAGSDFAFWYASKTMNSSFGPQQIYLKPKFENLTCKWKSYYDQYSQVKFINCTGKDLQDALQAPINSDLASILQKTFESFHDFQLQKLPISSLLPLAFLSNLQLSTTGIRISTQNLHYQLCESYSAIFTTPDTNLSKPSFFVENRFPIQAFSRVLRCGKILPECDYSIFNGLIENTKSEKLVVIDLGHSGFEPKIQIKHQIFSPVIPTMQQLSTAFDSTYQQNLQNDQIQNSIIIDFSAQNIVEILTNQQKLIQIEREGQNSYKNQLTNWPTYVRQIVQISSQIATLCKSKDMVLVAGAEERQIGSVILCCSEILLNPEFRTAKGLNKAIWKHLVQPGFVFDLKLLVLLFDCVDFAVQNCCKSFLFSRGFLGKYLAGLCSRQYGEFLFRSEFEKVVLGVTLTSQLLETNVGVDFEGEVEAVDFGKLEAGIGGVGVFWGLFQ